MTLRNEQQMATIATRRMKDLHLEIAKKWSVPVNVLAGTTFGLGVTMLFETGHTEEQIVEFVRQLVGDLSDDPSRRGVS